MDKRISRKYGMQASTIAYFQNEAISSYRMAGIYTGRGTLESTRMIKHADGRMLAHAVIGLAAVASPEHLRAVLSGTRGKRWTV